MIDAKKVLVENTRLDCSNVPAEFDLVVEENKEINLYLSNFYLDHCQDLSIEVKDGAVLHVSILADKKIENLNLLINLGKNAQLFAYFADFSNQKNKLNVVANLNGEGANFQWRLASLSSKNDKKEIYVSVYHNAPNTIARVDNYGVAKDESKLLFAGTSQINNGMIKSKTQQNAKIMVFDEACDAIAKPILKIDENDIEASHAAAVGKISDDHVFYLTSRGLSLEEAKMLITLGYLKPIFKGFEEGEIEYMNKIMEERL